MAYLKLLALHSTLFLLLLALAHAAPFELTHSGTLFIQANQYINFSNNSVGPSGDVMWDNRSGITVDFTTSGSNGFFNASSASGIDGLGPNLNLSKVYKAPLAGSSTDFGESFYNDTLFPLFAQRDAVVVLTDNNTYAAFVVDVVNTTGNSDDVLLNITINYYYNANGSNLFADKPSTGCAKHLNESSCYDSAKTGASCYWDFFLDMCNEAGGSEGGAGSGSAGGGSAGNFVDCLKFDGNAFACRNISVCQYTESGGFGGGGFCDPTADFGYEVGLNCSTFSSSSLCNDQPHTNPLCSWNGTACNDNTTKTYSDLPAAPYTTCDAAPSQVACTNLSNNSFLPCSWDSGKSKCAMNAGSIFGGSGFFGDIFDVTTKSSCEAMGGQWKTETYSFDNSYGQSQTSTDSWCEMSFGDYSKENCADSCWACENQDDGNAWPDKDAAQTACLNSSVGYCTFYDDPNALNGFGWCEPNAAVGFGFIDCGSNCNGCFTNATCAASAASCTWTADASGTDLDGNGSFDNQSDGFCDPQGVAAKKDCSQNCFACASEASCTASAANGTNGCTWTSNLNYCANATPGGASLEVCFLPGDEDGNGAYDCADPACGSDPGCGFGFGTGESLASGLGAIDPSLCIQHDNDQNNCNSQKGPSGTPLSGQNVCYYHPAPGQQAQFPGVGWCDPVFNKDSAEGMTMNAPPVILGVDQPADVSYPWLDIVGFGIHDSPETIDVGIAVSNMTNFTACYKAYKGQPGKQNATGKFFRYFDVDSNTTNGCAADNNHSITGFEYKFVHQYSNGSSHLELEGYNSTFDSKVAYKCVSQSWVPFGAQLTFMQDACSFGGGIASAADESGIGGVDVLLIKKSDIGSPKVPIRIYVATHNGTNVSVDSAGPKYYTPGSVDAVFEDCSAAGQDFDGDGLNAENDPDCQKFIKLGYVPFEGGPKCSDGKDNDGNGLTDCADPACKYDPYGGCGFGLACDSTDFKSPQIKWKDVSALVDSASVDYDSNEPANGTVLFYHNDSSCLILNKTVKDAGLLDGITDNDFSPWHDSSLDKESLGYALSANTTYYYKIKMVDLCGNALVSKCSNFTTATSFKTFIFKPTLPENVTMSIPNLSITNNTFKYGKKLNQSDTRNIEIMVNDTFHDYGITLQNCTATKAFDINFSGAFVFNGSTKAVGMNTDKWQEASQELGCNNIKVKIPSSGDQVWHCDEDNATNCYRVDNETGVSCTFGSSAAECTVPVSQGLGFSVYEPRTGTSSGGGDSGSSGSGGGGGGGGGGGTAASDTVKSSRFWDSIAANEQKVMAVKSDKISLSAVSFSVSEAAESVTVTVSVVDSLPETVASLDAAVYQRLEISHGNIESSNVNSARIEFSVPLQWLLDNALEAEDVSLYRYTASWAELPTTYNGDEGDSATYTAISPSLSYFAVAARPSVALPSEEPPEEVNPPPETEALQPVTGGVAYGEAGDEERTSGTAVIIIATLAVLAVAAVILFVERKRLSKKK